LIAAVAVLVAASVKLLLVSLFASIAAADMAATIPPALVQFLLLGLAPSGVASAVGLPVRVLLLTAHRILQILTEPDQEQLSGEMFSSRR
jgi:hypothetical protein